ncbi:MAG: hypothetical protein ACLTQI_01800 [Slackia sp.]
MSPSTPPAQSTAASHMPSISGAQVFKKFIGYYSKYKFLFWFDLVCATLLACIDLAFPQLLNFFTRDFFLQPAPVVMGALGLICVGMVALYLLRTGCQWFIARWGHVMGARIGRHARRLVRPVPAPQLFVLRQEQHRRNDEPPGHRPV